MLFGRRRPSSLSERIRVALWPRRSWSRSFRYFGLRLWRLSGSPHRVALGFAAGIFAIVTPFLGLQMLLAAIIALLLRGSVTASALGSFAGNPLTYPVIWFLTYKLGAFMLGQSTVIAGIDFEGKAQAVWTGIRSMSLDAISAALQSIWPIIKPMAVGSIPIGLAIAALSYVAVRRLMEGAKQRNERVNFTVA